MCVVIYTQLVGELSQIAVDVMPRLVVGEIIVVEIPIEACLTLSFKREEEPLLDLLDRKSVV